MNYKNGKLQGKVTWYSKKGKLFKDLQYERGLLHGKCRYFDSLGNIESKGIYIKGIKDGDWSYYKTGKLLKTENHTKPKKQ